MASVTKQSVLELADGVAREAGGSAENAAVCDGVVSVRIALPGAASDAQRREHVRMAVEAGVRRMGAQSGEDVRQVTVEFSSGGGSGGGSPKMKREAAEAPRATARADVPGKQASSSQTVRHGQAAAQGAGAGGLLPNVRHVIAVGAGKGGVGKSTVAVTLAIGLARKGHAVGLLDGDIYGPSVPTLLGLDALPVQLHENMLQVFNVQGIKAMTIGKLVEPDKPLIWRGPMAHGAFKQLVEQTAWGELDYLIIDLPPGTGDVPLTMSQLLKLTGAVIVCTPQRVAQDDAVRAVRMFQQLSVPVLGVVENMSYFIGDDGKEYDIFGRGGAEQMAQRLGVPFLGAVPINMRLRELCDAGEPVKAFADAGSQIKSALEGMIRRVEDEVALEVLRGGGGGPVLNVSE